MAPRLLAGVSASPGLAAGEARHVAVLPEVPAEVVAPDRRGEEMAAARPSLAVAAEDLKRPAQGLLKAGPPAGPPAAASGAASRAAAAPPCDRAAARPR